VGGVFFVGGGGGGCGGRARCSCQMCVVSIPPAQSSSAGSHKSSAAFDSLLWCLLLYALGQAAACVPLTIMPARCSLPTSALQGLAAAMPNLCHHTGHINLYSCATQQSAVAPSPATASSLFPHPTPAAEIASDPDEAQAFPLHLLPKLPDTFNEEHLVIDALGQGNVARFINHSCNPNLIVQVCVL
jgi:hypothetical protein